ncbi:hypothetical protein L1987_42749 [Smallanthus sonchifolius]|uniref:Uncharacterized protein n=1 Tax=Smallanthus sonchifolius TaxID=185202 RepID=A0ACB9GKS7_9ASTR|nr:hypothetical protein L1987_42749 [Smallanthus sonchifolius]
MFFSLRYPCDHDLILYNPFSGEFNTVPQPRSIDTLSNYVYGFGYGTTADDLKIVRLRDCGYGSKSSVLKLGHGAGTTPFYSPLIILVLDIKKMVFSEIKIPDGCTFANGFLYWIAGMKMDYVPLIILVLGIKKMEFSDIKIPYGCWLHRLGTYNGRLCMVCSQNNVEGSELRVMNEHGFGKSWSTVCRFKASLQNILCVLDDGKLRVLKPSKQVIIYDMFKDLYKEVDALTSFVQVIWWVWYHHLIYVLLLYDV